jgi:predicted RNA-binding protein with EMAP domain
MQSRTAELSEQERTGQIEWFESLLEALEEGKVEDAKAAIRAAVGMLEKNFTK